MAREPLLLRFIHKPSRSSEFFEKAQDQTRRNLLINALLGHDNEASPLDENDNKLTSSVSEKGENRSSSDFTPITSENLSDHEIDDEHDHRLIRKKSGEIVKPLLKDCHGYFASYFGKSRTQSLPSTPMYKLVHFGGDTDVKYFNQKDKPKAISAQNSPNTSDDETDEDFQSEADTDLDTNFESDLRKDLDKVGSTKFTSKRERPDVNWHLKLPNFPDFTYEKKVFEEKSCVFLERMFISIDQKYLLGHIAVKNIAFQKSIMVRYTLDNWLTIIEIPTIYVPDTPQILKKNSYDRFIFKIPLYNLFNTFGVMLQLQDVPTDVNEKLFELCIKYNANEQEYWDNNYNSNYKLVLTKIPKAPTQNTSKLNAYNSNKPNKPRYLLNFLKRVMSDLQIIMNLNLNLNLNEINNAGQHNEDNKQTIDSTLDKNDPNSNLETSPATPHLHFNLLGNLLNYSNLKLKDETSPSVYLISPILSMKSDQKTQPLHLNLDSSVNDTSSKIGQNSKFRDDGNVSPDDETFSPTKAFNKFSKLLHKDAKKVMDTKSYKDLLDAYCFFSKDNDVSKPEDENNCESDNPLSTVSSNLGFEK